MTTTWWGGVLGLGLVGGTLLGAGTITVTPLGTARSWAPVEFRLSGLPTVGNPFDPELMAVDGAVTAPTGGAVTVPAFWYQDYDRALAGGREVLAQRGDPEWRLRFFPVESGPHRLELAVRLDGQPAGAPFSYSFKVEPAPDSTGPRGMVRRAANGRFFETTAGDALPLLGSCVCWHGARGTYDYDAWFGGMQVAGENYARLWMAPWAFGFETEPGSLTRYRLDRAWQLDYVFEAAAQRGIYLMLCFDYHGMFEVQPDYWGGNNYWPANPYNVAQGGPCADQASFFTQAQAKRTYQKRLRYLIARYGSSPNLLAWQFFNEIDNVYRYLDPSQVAAWHGEMGAWLKAHDPWQHLVTTSLTGSSDRPEIWQLEALDFAMYHSYGQHHAAQAFPELIASFYRRYQKPVMIGEFGTDWRGWRREQDPHLRGWRQGLWGGVLGGSVGTAMSWWWENIHSENLYSVYRAMADVLGSTTWGRGAWSAVDLATPGPPPTRVGEVEPGGVPFAATLMLNTGWGSRLGGEMALPTPLSATLAGNYLNSFVHGTSHSDLRISFRVEAWLGDAARLILHLNSVSSGAILTVRVNQSEVFRRSLPNKDGGWQVNNEYNEDISVPLPVGRALIEIRNAGADWFYLDWVRIEGVRPAEYANGWQPAPDVAGLRGETETLLYVVSPHASFPANATADLIEPYRQGRVTLRRMPPGAYRAVWHDPQSAARVGETTATASGDTLVVPLPEFSEDLAGILTRMRDVSLEAPRWSPGAGFECELRSADAGHYTVEASSDFERWLSLEAVHTADGAALYRDTGAATMPRRFYRAKWGD